MSDTKTFEFAVPEFDDATVAFGAPRSAYLTREQMGDDFYGDRNKFTSAAQSLFFKGGKLADHGLKFRAGIDRDKAVRAIRALLCSFDPKHEIKIGTVGYALSQWCEAA
jgi:hypothetical protein